MKRNKPKEKDLNYINQFFHKASEIDFNKLMRNDI